MRDGLTGKIEYQTRYPITGDQAPIVNPLAWTRSVQAYLSLLALARKTPIPGVHSHLSELWTEGLRVREAILRLTSGTFRIDLFKRYCTNCGGTLLKLTTDQDPIAALETVDVSKVSITEEEAPRPQDSIVNLVLQQFENFAAARQIQRERSTAIVDTTFSIPAGSFNTQQLQPVPEKGRTHYPPGWITDDTGKIIMLYKVNHGPVTAHVRYITLGLRFARLHERAFFLERDSIRLLRCIAR